jgi:hypothetical protein
MAQDCQTNVAQTSAYPAGFNVDKRGRARTEMIPRWAISFILVRSLNMRRSNFRTCAPPLTGSDDSLCAARTLWHE